MYFTPYVDASGLHIPTYDDILDYLIDQYKTIYGQAAYLGNDSADYQDIAVRTLMPFETLQAVQLAYNSRGPATAIGSALDGVVKMNGISRKAASYSTCQVTLTGTPDTVINNGIVADDNGYKWDLPTSVTIDLGGTVTVAATCETIGAITALIGTITTISTPTAGWTSVTNVVAAVAGQAIELDTALRSRQAISTQLPSQTLLDGTTAGIAAVSGVARYRVYENDTNLEDDDGLPPHSITAVAEGGTDADIAEQIYKRKGIGCYTNGTTSVAITDEYGRSRTIRFYRPSYVSIDVAITVKALAGYTTALTAAIKTAIAEYLYSLAIGTDLSISALWYAALSVIQDMKTPTFTVTALTACVHGGMPGATDIAIAFNEVTDGDEDNITVTVT